MRLAEKINPKLPEIRRWAENFFEAGELRPYGLYFDPTGAVALDPANPMNQPQSSSQGMAAWTPEERETLYAKVRDDVGRFYTELDQLIAAFGPYGELDPLDLTGLLGELGGQGVGSGQAPTTVYARIGYADSSGIAPVDDLINADDWSGWSGNAAKTFELQLLQPFHQAAELQQQYVRELALVVQAFHDHVGKMSEALVAVADECIDALGGPTRTSADDMARLVNDLSITSIVAGALGFFVPAAGGVSLGAGIISYVAPLAVDTAPGPPLEQLQGETVWDVLRATRHVLATMEDFRADNDGKLARALDDAMNSTSSLAHPSLTVEPPDLADDPGQASFGQLTVGSVAGVPLDKDKVVVSVVNLYRACKVHLAGAAAQYDQAAAQLKACEVAPPVAAFFPSSKGRYDEARRLLQGILARARDSLTASAETLMTIAKNYQTTDDRIREAFDQIGRLQTPDATPAPERLGGV